MLRRDPAGRSTRRAAARALRLAAALGLVAAVFAPVAVAAEAEPPEHVEGRTAYDPDGVIGATLAETIENIGDAMAALHRVELVVVAARSDAAGPDAAAQAGRLAQRVAAEWDLSRAVVLAVVAPADGCDAGAAVWTVGPLDGADLDSDRIESEAMGPAIDDCDPATATLDGVVAIVSGLAGVGMSPIDPTASGAGPPFPDPEIDRAVYDQAGVFRPETIASAEATIDAIEARTGAEVVVYSQVVPYGITTSEAESHAQALMDQWGVGRRGIDDGLVILFDLDPSLEHGQVQLYAGPGYRAAYLANDERQRIFDEEMVPFLQEADLDGALLVALQRIDENATPEHAARLERARQLDAAVGLIGAPIVLVGLVGSVLFAWLRYGRDPVYLDDPSIHMAGPPAELTPAAATFVLAGESSRRALTTALLDLASRGQIAFREESELLGLRRKIGVQMDPPVTDDVVRARQARNSARSLGPAERLAHRRLATIGKGEDGYIDPDELLKFGTAVDDFDKALEDHVVAKGWFRERPSAVTARWTIRAAVAFAAGVGAIVLGANLPSGGLVLVGIALAIGAVVVFVVARAMEAVSLPGAMIRAMLAAYRRTLEKTMDQARSMDQVVAEAGFPWLETPDQAVVWGTALGLQDDVERVLERSLDDVRDGRVAPSSAYSPAWYGVGGDGGSGSGGGGGLFSSSAVPNIGGMMSVLGSIGNSPSSSGSGGGGGFGGGGSGGGGGGSGGGF